MRLTLRVLLAYLDDTLEPSQVKTIGQKVAESDTAQELIARIKQVTRRRRLTVPTEGGEGKTLDANMIAEYLDDAATEDEAVEVEQIALGSDVHLAEIAACHQIQTLVSGEPILIPPSSQQRMYGLVEGRAAIPSRTPPTARQKTEKERDESYETDETLRMGLPAFQRSSWKSRLVLIGGCLAACALLVVAVFMAMNSSGDANRQKGQKIAANQNDDKDKNQKVDGKNDKAKKTNDQGIVGKKKKVDDKAGGKKKNGANVKVKPKHKGKKPPMPKPPVIPPPSDLVREVGNYKATGKGLLLQYQPDNKRWQSLGTMKPVMTGSRLVSLPGFQSAIETTTGLRLVLWGLQPEQVFFQTPLLESVVELHHNPKVGIDATLQRGRLVITNQKDDPVQVLLRFSSPTFPQAKRVWNLTLEGNGTEILIERWTLPANEPFYPDAKNPNRKGPLAIQHLLVTKGKVSLQDRNSTTPLEGPPGTAYVLWNSFNGSTQPAVVEKLPDWATGLGKLPDSLKQEQRAKIINAKTEMEKATEKLAEKMASSTPKVVFTTFLKSDDNFENLLALRCFTAIDDLPILIDAMNSDNPKRARARVAAIMASKRWLSYDLNNDYLFYDALLAERYDKLTANDAMTLLHPISPRDLRRPETYLWLADQMMSPKIAIRTMVGWSLYVELPYYFSQPLAANIQFDPTASEADRQAARDAWRKLIDEGKIPPQQKAPSK